MNLDKAAELCKKFEGFSAKPYLCPANVPTIGYGSTYYADGTKVSLDDPEITEERATALLIHELEETFLPAVRKYCPEVADDENKSNALVSFTYNLGAGNLASSTLRKKVNACDWQGAADEFPKWRKAGGKVLRGLELRRAAERALFLSDN
jgi:lysozyme